MPNDAQALPPRWFESTTSCAHAVIVKPPRELSRRSLARDSRHHKKLIRHMEISGRRELRKQSQEVKKKKNPYRCVEE